MRYWFYDERTKRVRGPHLDRFLVKQEGFSPDTKVALEGARGPEDWKPAKDVDALKSLLVPKGS
ncbi:MAG: hypothetical protein KGL74_04590 [Elusimicrobia bacterium]|nr:hypothetical protein [Elusimicrobiota bacterium]